MFMGSALRSWVAATLRWIACALLFVAARVKRFASIGATWKTCQAVAVSLLNAIEEGAEFSGFLTNAIALSAAPNGGYLRSTVCSNGARRTRRQGPPWSREFLQTRTS